MSLRINNSEFLKLYLPLNNHTDDVSGNGNDGTPTSLGYVDGPFGGIGVGDFDGSSDVTYTEATGITRFAWWEDIKTFRYTNGIDFFTNAVLGSSFTVRVTTTQVGVGYTGQIWNVRLYNTDLTQEEILEIYNLERRSPKLVEIQQPFDLLPDITDSALELAILNSKVHNTFRDYSNNANDATPVNNNIAFEERAGATFNSNNLTWPSLTVTSQKYFAKESDGWNMYAQNSSDTFKNGVPGASLPVTMTSTGFTPLTIRLKDVEIYSDERTDAVADYAKAVPDPSLLLHLIGGDKDLSRFARDITNVGVIAGGKRMEFNGITSLLDLGPTDFLGVGDITVMGWINAAGPGESNLGFITTNGRFLFSLIDSGTALRYRNISGGAQGETAANAIELNRWFHVAISRFANDTVSFYVNGVLSGAEGQDANSVIAGTTNIIVGNEATASATFDGRMANMKIFSEIKPPDYILQDYLSTRIYF